MADHETYKLQELYRSAEDGDPAAMRLVGKLALVGEAGARSASDGARLLASAAEAGDAEADAVIAVLVGADARSDSDWGTALDYLGRAAARGWEPAQRQYRLLCRDRALVEQSRNDAAPSAIWQKMRDAIDPAALTGSPPARVVHESPRIAVIEGFASHAECDWAIERARPHIARAGVFDRESGSAAYESARTNSAVTFNILLTDLVLVVLQARIAAASGFSAKNLEEMNILHYAPGQKFDAHYDFFDPAREALRKEIAEKGQRAVTFLVYLNEQFEGGETEFLKLGWRYRGRRGDALLFHNLDASDAPDERTLHAGRPPLSGEKWLLSQWIRARPPLQATR